MTPGSEPGERDRRAKLTERAREAEHRPCGNTRGHERQGDQSEHLPSARTERRGGVLRAPVGTAQRALHREDEERHRDKGLREHDGAGRERDAESGVGKQLPDESATTEQYQQGDAADDRRQHEGNRDRGTKQSSRNQPPGTAAAKQQGERNAERETQSRRRGRGHERRARAPERRGRS